VYHSTLSLSVIQKKKKKKEEEEEGATDMGEVRGRL